MGQHQSTPEFHSLFPSNYIIHNYIPNTIIHQPTNQLQTIKMISAHSSTEQNYYNQLITQYQQNKCGSVMKLVDWRKYKESNKIDSYCSEQISYYLIFEGSWNSQLGAQCQALLGTQYKQRKKQQFGGFSIQEVYAILCCMLCGTREYYQTFKYKQWEIDLNMIHIDANSNKSLTLLDPLFAFQQSNKSQKLFSSKRKYMAPQKLNYLKTRSSQITAEQPLQFLSQLFTIGMIGLQLLTMNLIDPIPNQQQLIDRYLLNDNYWSPASKSHGPQSGQTLGRVITGITRLVSNDPSDRINAYSIMNVMCNKTYCISNKNERNRNQIGRPALKMKKSMVQQEKINKIYPNTSFLKKPITYYQVSQNTHQPTINKQLQNQIVYQSKHNSHQFIYQPPINSHHIQRKNIINIQTKAFIPQSQKIIQPERSNVAQSNFSSKKSLPGYKSNTHAKINFNYLHCDPQTNKMRKSDIAMHKERNPTINGDKFSYETPKFETEFTPIFGKYVMTETNQKNDSNVSLFRNNIVVNCSENDPQRQSQVFHNISLETKTINTQKFESARPTRYQTLSTSPPKLYIPSENREPEGRLQQDQPIESISKAAYTIKQEDEVSSDIKNQTFQHNKSLQKSIHNSVQSNQYSIQSGQRNSDQPRYPLIQNVASTYSNQLFSSISDPNNIEENFKSSLIIEGAGSLKKSLQYIQYGQSKSEKKLISNVPITSSGEYNNPSQQVVPQEEQGKTSGRKFQIKEKKTSLINQLIDDDSSLRSPNTDIIQESYIFGEESENQKKYLFLEDKQSSIPNQYSEQFDSPNIRSEQSYVRESLLGKNTTDIHQSQQIYEQVLENHSSDDNDHIESNQSYQITKEDSYQKVDRLVIPNYTQTIIQEESHQSEYNEEQSDNKEDNLSEQSGLEFIVEEYESGSRYEGFKVNNIRTGMGKFYYQDGGYFDGEWKDDKMHGWGRLYYENGQIAYEGYWVNDEFHGHGKVYNDEPRQLEEGFDYTNFDLLGNYWLYYQGNLCRDTKQGCGKIYLTNGQLFEGDFYCDKIQGFGKFFRQDGAQIEGIWKNSRLVKIISTLQTKK